MDKDDKNKQISEEIVYEDEAGPKKVQKQNFSETEDVVALEENEPAEILVKKLRERLKICEKEKQEYMDGWQRERADLINYKKRAEEEKKEYIKFANESLLEEILVVLESFDMAFMNKEQWNAVPQNWRVGVEYIHSQLVKVLDDNGLKEFMPKIGDRFDSKMHVAEEMMPVEKQEEDGLIKEIKKKGYILNGRIIIAPTVIVGEYKK